MNVIVKLKNKNNELKYRDADFYINLGKNINQVVVYLLGEKQELLLIANEESVEYIYLYEEELTYENN